MIKQSKGVQNGCEKPRKRYSQEGKIRRHKSTLETLKEHNILLKRIDRRTRMLMAGLRELLILGEDYVSMVACQDEIDVALLNALREAGATGRQSGELAEILNIDHRHVPAESNA